LSQGGEFAFVLLSLAKELKVLPDELNRLLIIVVVLSMALTPFLAELGKTVADASAASRIPEHAEGVEIQRCTQSFKVPPFCTEPCCDASMASLELWHCQESFDQ
jgi:Kef-type K+ transport system membrane component KefB